MASRRWSLGDGAPIRIDAECVEALGRLRRAIPPDQHVRVAGKLDVLRLSDRMFTLILASGARVRGVVAGHGVDLSALGELWGQDVVVTGVAKFRPSGSVLRIEAERIERANDRDLSLWSAEPRPIFGVLDERALRQAARTSIRVSVRSSVSSPVSRPTRTSSRHSIGSHDDGVEASPPRHQHRHLLEPGRRHRPGDRCPVSASSPRRSAAVVRDHTR